MLDVLYGYALVLIESKNGGNFMMGILFFFNKTVRASSCYLPLAT